MNKVIAQQQISNSRCSRWSRKRPAGNEQRSPDCGGRRSYREQRDRDAPKWRKAARGSGGATARSSSGGARQEAQQREEERRVAREAGRRKSGNAKLKSSGERKRSPALNNKPQDVKVARWVCGALSEMIRSASSLVSGDEKQLALAQRHDFARSFARMCSRVRRSSVEIGHYLLIRAGVRQRNISKVTRRR